MVLLKLKMITLRKPNGIISRYLQFVDRGKLKRETHQIEGIIWCENREKESYENKIYGGIVADEMGMGKTILMIGLMVCNFKKHTLIILPKSLLVQWQKEIKKYLHHDAYLLYGSSRVKNISTEVLNQHPIILTTYGTCVSLGDNSVLHNFGFDRIIVDEAHHLRNDKTKAFLSVKAISKKTLWLLTGTPIQNKIQDLFRLFDLLGIPSDQYKDYKLLSKIIQNVMLRRQKDAKKLNLPNLYNKNCLVTWKSEQEALKSKIFHQKFGTLTDSNHELNNIYYLINTNPLVASIHARMVCISPTLLNKKTQTIYDDYQDLYNENNEDFFTSTTKLESVVAKINENYALYPENKKIVFCHFKQEMLILQDKLFDYGIACKIYNGKLTTRQRQMLVEESPDVLLIQINSGSEGLNLQQYNEVYFVSPTWNPSLEQQALARCYRMGQQKQTYVYRFYMKDFAERNEEHGEQNEIPSMDSNIETRQEMKTKLVETMDTMCNQTISSSAN